MKSPHPAVEYLLKQPATEPLTDENRARVGIDHTTSNSLARALSVGLLSRLSRNVRSVNIWDPTVGTGYAGHMLTEALQAVGVDVQFRGQDINAATVSVARDRFKDVPHVDLSVGNSLVEDAHPGFPADLAIVDAPWGMSWKNEEIAVKSRQREGAFAFGLPETSDSVWLFISLALEKLRSPAEGGGRVAALVPVSALSRQSASAGIRKKVLKAGYLESVSRLPEALALNTGIPLYLLTLTNNVPQGGRTTVKIADLRTEFKVEKRWRTMPVSALRELESGLRSGKSGPRNRTVNARQFTRRDATLKRTTLIGQALSWPVTTYNDVPIDQNYLDCRYGEGAGVSISGLSKEQCDLDPTPIFGDNSRDLLKALSDLGWKSRRLSSVLVSEPQVADAASDDPEECTLFVPTYAGGDVSTKLPDGDSRGRVLSIRIDDSKFESGFLKAWLNSDQGVSSRRRAINAGSTGMHYKALSSKPRALMRWADELIVPVPDAGTQRDLAFADEQLSSFQAELSAQRAGVWSSPEVSRSVVSRFEPAFSDALDHWLDKLPYPLATALWTAQTASINSDKQRAYIHAWEAIATFHATVLLSVARSGPEGSNEIELGIRGTLEEHRIGIARASFATWVVISERISSDIRRLLQRENDDEIARLRRSFAGLSESGIRRLVSNEIVQKLNDVNQKRNRWLGHSGHISDEEWGDQIDSLLADLRDLRELYGNVWTELSLVRAGSSKRLKDGYLQSAELAVGARSPFSVESFRVGEAMIDGDLYLVRDGADSPLRLAQFVQLRAAPAEAHYTTYFYNRTEDQSVRMVSYQHGPASEINEDVSTFQDQFGALGP